LKEVDPFDLEDDEPINSDDTTDFREFTGCPVFTIERLGL